MGRFVTFEGCEGCGKTTQMGLASAWLKERGVTVLETAEPGGTPLGRTIRSLLLNRGACTIGAEAELLLFAAARAQHVRETILPALASGRWVLCDRFTDATLVYQGFGRGIDRGFIQRLNTFSAGSLVPEMTVLLDLPVATGLERAAKRSSGGPPDQAEDRFEQEDLAFHGRIREGYLRLAAGEPGRFRIIDGALDVGSVHRAICRSLAELFR